MNGMNTDSVMQPIIIIGDMDKDYTQYSREELIAELEKQKRYYQLLVKATRNYAMQLLDELKKLRPENE